MLPSSIMRTASDVLEMRGEREHKIQTAAVLYWNSFVCGCALLFPFGHFGLIAAVVLAIQYFSSRELRSILPHGGLRDPGTGMTIAGLVQSLAVYIACIFAENPFEPTVLLFFVSAVCLTIELAPLGLQKKPSFPELLKAAASIVFLHFYTALLPSLIMLIVAGFPEARDAIITFALLTFWKRQPGMAFWKLCRREKEHRRGVSQQEHRRLCWRRTGIDHRGFFGDRAARRSMEAAWVELYFLEPRTRHRNGLFRHYGGSVRECPEESRKDEGFREHRPREMGEFWIHSTVSTSARPFFVVIFFFVPPFRSLGP